MNRKQKIIVSVTGIFLVLLILVGLTYAYFLTRIVGNTNDKSISVTTANLVLTYGDGNGILEVANKLQPGDDIQFYRVDSEGNKILDDNGEPIKETSKTFTVTNDGDDTDYVVIVDNVSITKDGESTTFVSNDFEYTLTCTSSDDNSCDGVDASTFPLSNQSILVGNKIASGVTHTYTLTMRYLETNVNQSDDMGKTFTARINIEDIRKLDNPYEEGTLAYNIINNSINATNGTELLNVSDTPVAEGISAYKGNTLATEFQGFYGWDYLTYGKTADEANNGENYISNLGLTTDLDICNSVKGQYISDAYDCNNDCDLIGKVVDCNADGVPILENVYIDEHESSLVVEQDDYGTSYYYRGNVEDNYVTFADMCWRIVRINGDGTTKLILEDQDQPCSTSINGNWGIPTTTGGSTYTGNFGYTQYNKNTLTASDGTQNSGTKYIMDYLHGQTNSASSMATAFKNFQSTFTETELSKLKSGNWCLGDAGYSRTGSSNSDYTYTLLNETQMSDYKVKGTSFYYDSYVRLVGANKDGYQPTLKCNGTIMNTWEDDSTNPIPMYVGTITADEMVYAGASWVKDNKDFYLMNDSFKNEEFDYYYFWSLSPNRFSSTNDGAFYLNHIGGLDGDYVGSGNAFRPAVSLRSGSVITDGEGTLEKPYIIG